MIKNYCPSCGIELPSLMSLAGSGDPYSRLMTGHWVSRCACCHNPVSLQMPVGHIVVCFADDSKRPDSFKDSFDGINITDYLSFETDKEFIHWWVKEVDRPRGMWYYVMVDGILYCCGAVDPYDIDIWRAYFDDTAVEDGIAAAADEGVIFDDPYDLKG